MKLVNRCLPYGKLPYDSIESTERMIEKIFYTNPYLPVLPKLSEDDSILTRTISGFGFRRKGKNIIIASGKWVEKLDFAYNHVDSCDMEAYLPKTPFGEKYYEMLEKTRPAESIITLTGAFSLAQMIQSAETEHVLLDKNIRKIIVQALTLKAIAFIKKVKELSPKTKLIIMFDESLLNTFGILKRENEDINREVVISILSKIFARIQQEGGFVGVQCFEKCDWSLIIDSGVNLISFDAYNNPNNIGVIADKINNFIAGGGYINWAIVPVRSDEQIKHLKIDDIYNRFTNTVDAIAEQGVHGDNIYKKATVSVQGDMDKISIFFAEKALLLTAQLAKKLYVNHLQKSLQ